MSTPTEPSATAWVFPAVASADEDGIVGIGADLEPGTLLAAYRAGIFPTPVGPDEVMAWWSPDPRAIIPLGGLHVSRSLHRSLARFDVTFDDDFEAVVAGCADPSRDRRWITDEVAAAYGRLHSLGWAHSVEVWDGDGRLAGGLYGVSIGGLFAGESMFHRVSNASKVALVGLVEHLKKLDYSLFDVQWQTQHLASMGAVEVSREHYMDLLAGALTARRSPGF